MRMHILAIIYVMLITISANATFVPEDQIDYNNLSTGDAQLTEQEFHKVIKQISDNYIAVVTNHGGKLSIQGDWKSEKLNAGATQMFGTWKIVISGGLARRPELSADGMALIVCHELGHHLGGFPIAPANMPIGGTWAANEGQSDYFATQICAKKIWGSEFQKNAEFRQTATEIIKNKCLESWESIQDQNLCFRILTAVESMTNTMGGILAKPAPQFSTPDPTIVSKTSHAHPAIQCRMDTSFHGAVCPVIWDELKIPGKKVNGGIDSIAAEEEASKNSCMAASGFDFGLRPLCWFKPRM